MLIYEVKKMLNWRVLLLVVMAGIVLMYSGPFSQMNLKHLPLFETVEAQVGSQFRQMYGKEYDAEEIAEIEIMKQNLQVELEKSIMKKYPQIEEYGFSSFENLEEYWSQLNWDDEASAETLERIEAIDQLYMEIICDEELDYSMETVTYYESIVTSFQQEETMSVVPSSVMSNMSFVMEGFASSMLILVIIMVLPYLAMDNYAGVYPLAATTRTGRSIILKQLAIMLCCVAVLIAVCNVAFFAGIKVITPYEPFLDCIPDGIWKSWTLEKFWLMQVLLIDGAAIVMALIVFVISSLCKTIVGTVAAAIPCWGLSQVLSMYVLDEAFTKPTISVSIIEEIYSSSPAAVPAVIAVLAVTAVFMTAGLCITRNRSDITE